MQGTTGELRVIDALTTRRLPNGDIGVSLAAKEFKIPAADWVQLVASLAYPAIALADRRRIAGLLHGHPEKVTAAPFEP
jgi:hypothetical protein